TLTATQNGNNVDFLFTNTGAAGGSGAFDTRLQMMYNGSTSGITMQNTGGVAGGLSFNGGVGPLTPWDLVISWSSSNRNSGANRLDVGEFSAFTLLGVQLSNLFFGSGSNPSAMIHVQGLDPVCTQSTQFSQPTCETSTKYTISPPAPVPVPAAGLMLVAGLGGLGVLRRRRKAA
ncbi:MAG: VPLPA-CTERM sorting domain-containing protein, partial [Paracoccaceae bacterium]